MVVLTLTEKSTLAAPVYLFEFINRQTAVKSYFIAEDISGFQQRFNKFIIVEKETPDPLEGEIELILTGQYSYNVYEQESETNLNPSLALGIVETGKVTVTGSITPVPEYTPDNNTTTVYNG